MGKTVPSYRMALESEIETWKAFKDALTNEADRQAFEAIMDACRRNAMAGGAACNPILFEPMIMSILLAQQKKILELEKKLCEALQTPTDSTRSLLLRRQI